MKQIACLLGMLLMAATAYTQPTPKIKILLLGTFHFGETGDKGKTSFEDLFSAKRQREIQQLTNQLASLKPDKIFVENEPSRQAHWDSLYNQYRQGTLDTTALRNEIFQIAVRTARKAGLQRVICVDHIQSLPYDKLEAFDQRTSKDSVALRQMATYKLLSLPYPYPKKTKKLASTTLGEYLTYVNSPEYEASNRADYFVYAPSSGYDTDYTGVEFITSWYDRNAKIFTNILRQAEPTDTLHIVLFGASHMLPLRHYFQMHPYFEVIELADVLK
ncbi:DUF5694 domain-containing protein [Spirosoma radiotolerans]|uniref:Uncharacterized protein n=1 Tax=Spirosoma radiotolerans TaxID=1379870 RepID=A0A0E3ZVX8_9BACT|nr:DUF5694 domain-containing protein [Spirosoma radiotolerans]AKD55384.1 hypothetical protein SD10_11215 [Spirosoma radiotolerans]